MAKGFAALATTTSKPGKKKKNVPIFSHEFIQENHSDIVSMICIVVICGVMFEVTRPLFTPFLIPQHYINGTLGNASNGTNFTGTEEESDYIEEEDEVVAGRDGALTPSRTYRYRIWYYENGPLDALTVCFYTLVWIVIHALVKELIWDRFQRRLHLSKVKTFLYYEAGNVFFYSVTTFIGATVIILREGFLKEISVLWKDYPQTMTVQMKLFMIIQIAFWLHNVPELYFHKAKREDIASCLQFYIFNAIPIVIFYVMRFQRVGILLLALHALGEAFHQGHTLLGLWRDSAAHKLTPIWTFFFILVRLASVALATVVFIVGLPKEAGFDLSKGNFNTLTVRLSLFSAVLLLQLWLVWQFTTSQLAALRDRQERQRIRTGLSNRPDRRQRQKENSADGSSTDGQMRARNTTKSEKKTRK